MLKIDFGSGYNPRKGYKTCDITYSPFLDYVYDIHKNKIIPPKNGVRKVFETPSGYFDIKINERMIIK